MFSNSVSVVVPGDVGTPHDEPTGIVAVVNGCYSQYTSPVFTLVPTNKVSLKTIWMQWLTIKVVDQFGEDLGDLYENAEVEELLGSGWHTINQFLDSAGCYQDPVGDYCNKDGFAPGTISPAVLVDPGSSEAGSWSTEPLEVCWSDITPPVVIPKSADVRVRADGFELGPQITNRVATINWGGAGPSNVSVNITWP